VKKMSNQRFDLGKAPHISIADSAGDLVVRSWMELDVVVKGDNFEANETEGGLSLSAQGDLQLMVPEGTHLSVEGAHGDVVIKNISGDVSLHEVHGDTVLMGLNQVKLGTLHSDLSAKNIDGSVNADSINGDAVFRNVGDLHVANIHGDMAGRNINGSADLGEVAGDISLNTVNGDLNIGKCRRDANLQNLGGINTVAHASGDIRLVGGLISGDHSFTADGDILVRWPIDAPLNLTASAPDVKNKLPMENVADKDGTLLGTIGDGKTNVNLQANGRILLKEARLVKAEWEAFVGDGMDFDFTLDLAGLGEEITSKVNEQVSRVTAELETRFGPDFSQRIADKAEKAATQAEKAAERAVRKFEKHIERAAQRQSRSGRSWKPPTPPAPPQPKKSTAEEQLKILKMVENGTISPDEAAMLLSALDN
jgi:hypothetical protein